MNIQEETIMMNEVIDDILQSDYAKEFKDDKVGKDEYYFSEHSKNLDIIYQFEFDEEFLKKHEKLKKYLEDKFRDAMEDLKQNDDFFSAWFDGYTPRHIFDGFFLTLIEKLQETYRKRITETYKCADCGEEISEKYRYGHENHLYRIGYVKDEAKPPKEDKDYKHVLLCRKCYRERTERKEA